VGTASPATKLNVALAANQVASFHDGTNVSAVWGINGGLIGRDSEFQISAVTGGVPITFRTGATRDSAASSGTERMRITSTGNVGIGTTGPSEPIEIVRNQNAATVGLIRNTTSGADAYTAWSVYAQNNGMHAFALSDALSRSYPGFHAGASMVKGSATNGLNIISDLGTGTSGAGTGMIRFITSTTDVTTESTSNDAKTRMVIDATGKVGIGTTSPQTPLHVNGTIQWGGTASAPYAYSGIDSSGLFIEQRGSTSGNSPVRIQSSASGDLTNYVQMFLDPANGTYFRATGSANGNFGIGDITPDFRFDVEATSATVAAFNRLSTDGTVIEIQQDGATEGSISVSGTTVSYNAFTGSHYAWTEEIGLERGTLVSLTGSNRRLHGNERSEILYGIARTATENDRAVLGSYLALQESQELASDDNPHLVMAVGNGEMWVTETDGNLQIGDYLVASSVVGHAMKDPETFDVSHIIGQVLEPVDWAAVESVGESGKKRTLVSVSFVRFSRRNTEDGIFGAPLAELTVEGVADYKGYGLVNVGFIRGVGDLWSIDGNGKLTTKEIAADIIAARSVKVKKTDDSKSIGEAVILSGESYAQVHDASVKPGAKIFVTFRKNPRTFWWVDEVTEGLFIVKTDEPVSEDTVFDYWVIEVQDETTPPATEASGSEPLAPVPEAVTEPEPAPQPTNLEPTPVLEPAASMPE
jgi:hypothetical protein